MKLKTGYLRGFVLLLCCAMAAFGVGYAQQQESFDDTEPLQPAVQEQSYDAAPLQQRLFLDGINFYYKVDHDVYFLEHRKQWEALYKEPITLQALEELAYRSYKVAKLEEPLTIWREQGGPHPWIIQPKIHIVNNTPQAVTGITIHLEAQAQIGDYLANPDTFIVDYGHLHDTARWHVLYDEEVSVDALAPGEEKLIDARLFEFFKFLSINPHKWPVFLWVNARIVSARGEGLEISDEAVSKTLEMIPDHFIVPYPNKIRILQ